MNEPGAMWRPTSNFFAGREGNTARYIILHGTAGGTSAEAIASYFHSTEGSNNPVSSHYIIGVSGEVVQCVNESDGAWGNGALSSGHDTFWNENVNPNNITISIEHCKPSSDNHDQLTEAQMRSSFALVSHICQRWQIPMRQADARGGITGHFSIDPVNRTNCPGPYPWQQLWNFLKSGGNSMSVDLNDPVMAHYFEDMHNGTWRCRNNNVRIYGATRDFYCKYGGVAVFGLPLAEERTDIAPSAKVLPCERALIAFDPDRKEDSPPISDQCYLLHIDKGDGQKYIAQISIKPLEDQNTQLQDQLKQAQTQIATLTARLQQIEDGTIMKAYRDRLLQIHQLAEFQEQGT